MIKNVLFIFKNLHYSPPKPAVIVKQTFLTKQANELKKNSKIVNFFVRAKASHILSMYDI